MSPAARPRRLLANSLALAHQGAPSASARPRWWLDTAGPRRGRTTTSSRPAPPASVRSWCFLAFTTSGCVTRSRPASPCCRPWRARRVAPVPVPAVLDPSARPRSLLCAPAFGPVLYAKRNQNLMTARRAVGSLSRASAARQPRLPCALAFQSRALQAIAPLSPPRVRPGRNERAIAVRRACQPSPQPRRLAKRRPGADVGFQPGVEPGTSRAEPRTNPYIVLLLRQSRQNDPRARERQSSHPDGKVASAK